MSPAERHAAIFLNEGAGTARSEGVRRAVDATRSALDADLHVTATRDAAELEAWMRERIDGYSTAIVAGGDGSLGVAYNVAAGRDGLTLGYIPGGFGNAAAHLLRLPPQPEELARVLASHDSRPIDLVAVDGRLALFAGAGWDAIVAGRYAAAGAHRLRGWAAAVTRSLPDLWHRPQVEVRADGWRVHRGPMELLVVSTTPFYGRGLKVNPGARPDAGRLALRVYPGPAPRLAVEMARWVLRAPPQAEVVLTSSVELRSNDQRAITVQADGDVLGARDTWRFEIRPAAVRLIGRWS
ncbi:MAG: diacylglycerol/lipid kinase family protein [Candidatus Limnocylindria bacterium]